MTEMMPDYTDSPNDTIEELSDTQRALSLFAVIGAADIDSMRMIVIPGAPPSKARPRFTRNGRAYQDPKDRTHEERTRDYLREIADVPETGNVALGCVFFRPNYQRIDTDNMLKHVSDAANGVLWVDDSQVTAVLGFTEYDDETPRTIVVVAKHESTMRRGSDLNRACVICGKLINLIGKNPSVKTCSKACATRSRGYQPLNEPIICPQCGGSFVRSSQYQRLCSIQCRSARIAGSNRERSGDVPPSRCMDCDKELAHRRGGRCRECWRTSVAQTRTDVHRITIRSAA